MIILLSIVLYTLIGCGITILGLRKDFISEHDEDMVVMTIFVWPFGLLIACLYLLVEIVVKLGKGKDV